jgi:plasmid stabilization system protein ParE
VTRKVVRSEAAVEDMLGIVDDLLAAAGLRAALAVAVAVAVDERLDAAIESLDELGNRGRAVPELRARGITTYRELIVLPYRIIYRVEAREVWIVAVVDHRRDLDTLLHERARRDRA